MERHLNCSEESAESSVKVTNKETKMRMTLNDISSSTNSQVKRMTVVNECSRYILSNEDKLNSLLPIISIETKEKRTFEDLPGHMIRSGLLHQAVRTLADKNFIHKRILHLGIVCSAKAYVSDCKLLQKKLSKIQKKQRSPAPCSKAPSCSDLSMSPKFLGTALQTEKNIRPVIETHLSWTSSQTESTISLQTVDVFDEKGLTVTVFKKLKKCLMEANIPSGTRTHDHIDNPTYRDLELSFYLLGNYLYENDWYHEAMKFYRYCISVRLNKECQIPSEQDCTILGNALSRIGEIQGQRGKLDKALDAFLASIQKMKSSGDFVQVARIYNRIGDVYGAQGDLQNALHAYEKALKLQELGIRKSHLPMAETLHNIGVVYRHLENLESALENYKKALSILINNDGDDLDIARTLNNIGIIHRNKGEYDKAMQYFEEVLKVRRRMQGDYHASVNLTLIHYAKALRLKGDFHEALKFYDEAMK